MAVALHRREARAPEVSTLISQIRESDNPRCRRRRLGLSTRSVGHATWAEVPPSRGAPLALLATLVVCSSHCTGMPRGRAAACRACSSRILAHLGRTADVTTLRSRGGASSPARTRPPSHSLITSRILPHMTSAARPFTRHAAAVVRAQGSAWTRASTSSGPSTCARRPAGATRAKCSSASADADHFFDL